MNITRIHDISRVIAPGEAVYEGDDPLDTSVVCEIGEESPCRITALENWTTHFLTHVDAPRHFIPNGPTLDEVPLERFHTAALVIDIGESLSVTEDVLPEDDLSGVSVLFKTTNSRLSSTEFHRDHVYVTEGAARELAGRGVNLVGIDYLSVDKFGDEAYPAHNILLGAGTIILEGLNLAEIAPGQYTLAALPLRIADADGSPVRAALIEW